MEDFRYQDKLLYEIDAHTIFDFPHSTLLCGEKGCGKHTISKYIADKFKLPLVDITENIELDTLLEIYQNPNPQFYLIDASEISVKEQNVILKFLEEPNELTYIIIIAQSTSQLLDTIINRCIIYQFEKYTEEQLKTFLLVDSNDTTILKYCNTPGDVIEFQKCDIESIEGFCGSMFDKLHRASIPNVLNKLPAMLAFDGEQDKVNVDLFFKCLKITLYSKIVNGSNLYDEYLMTNSLILDCSIPHINKKHLYENYLMRLLQLCRRKNEA